MATKEKAAGGSDIPEWLVTFADLMSILVCFFVLLISFSIQDKEKLQVVAGSVKEAFGVIEEQAKAGIVERDGNPQRDYVKELAQNETTNDTDFASESHDSAEKQGPEANTYDIEKNNVELPNHFSLAAATLKQAWQDLPDITSVSDNLIVQETNEGLNIVIADQEGRPMFPENSKYPYEITRKAIAAIAPVLDKLPNQIRITGHTAAGATYPNPRYGPWELSSDRANVVRNILEEFGLSPDKIHSVVGRADAEPFFPNNPYLSANQRVSILVMKEDPPVPPELKL
ncbi:MAG: flagellar motor protein MotB [Hyphomicrobiaceae bacterium]|nr:flagellar motor protein MotB [Hyphomicrobiaceae bacterium]MCC0024086.1 flagellar motor protein MotB [Hyphomicrobiaceae bacterium]